MCYIVFRTLFTLQLAVCYLDLAFGSSALSVPPYVSHNSFFFLHFPRSTDQPLAYKL